MRSTGKKTANQLMPSDKPQREIPYAKELSRIADDVIQEISDDGRPGLERAGMLSLAILFKQYIAGELSPTQTFSLFKDLLMHKTPAPVQRLEAHVALDMGILLQEAVATNRASMEKLDRRAVEGKHEVMDRYGLDETLELPHRGVEGKVEDEATYLGEPDEIVEIRREGG